MPHLLAEFTQENVKTQHLCVVKCLVFIKYQPNIYKNLYTFFFNKKTILLPEPQFS